MGTPMIVTGAMLVLANGDRYVIRESDLAIIRTDQPDFMPSGKWTLDLLYYVRGRFGVGFKLGFKQAIADVALFGGWRFKNGKGRWRVGDVDHGTRREWAHPDGRRAVGLDIGTFARDSFGHWDQVTTS